MKRVFSALGLVAVGALAIVVACGAEDNNAGSFNEGDASAFGGPDSGVGNPIPSATGVIIVHGAALPSLRLCFEDDPSALPLPVDSLLPSANMVGLATGSIARVANLPRTGRVLAYDDAALAPFYPPGADGPTCDKLAAAGTASFDLGNLTNAPDAGVSVMVISGCQRGADDPDASVASCGDDWTAEDGNLAVQMRPITPYSRPLANALPLQVIQLSPGLDRLTRGQTASLSFGDLDGGATPFITQPLEAGAPAPDTPIAIDYDPTNTAAYASTGFWLAFDAGQATANATAPDAGDDAGDAAVLVPSPMTSLRQSLADIVALSASRQVPPGWLGSDSSYVLFIVGDPNAPSGATQLHFVIAPIALPDLDASIR